MDGGYSRINEETHPQLLDLIPNERNWFVTRDGDHNIEGSKSHHGNGDEKKLELRLGPPGVEDWSVSDAQRSYKSPQKAAQKRYQIFKDLYFAVHACKQKQISCVSHMFSHFCTNLDSIYLFFIFFLYVSVSCFGETHQLLGAPAPVVGWPPIRSFRKNIASSSSKQAPVSDSQNGVVSNNIVEKGKLVENCQKGFFVKINMNGVPIGRKVDLNAYDTYEKLSVAVDQLFRGLLAAQNDTSGCGNNGNYQDEKPITGLLDGNGEYTLVYEDNEGDRMLVGDVPWHMFVSSVKRLRVIKTSEISNISRKDEKIKV
ncbi:hypothetical protein SSX86_013539 [Deinandra increscens subsp. villosa]|uniref:Auxin-responsive protein n=1 Tax=Deinandra increscens subsp. villosa TaxID=3103831 RepID=A0AAP0D7R0_9ASTR